MKILKSCLIAAGVAMLGTGVAFAISPHFINAASSIDSVTGNLTCSWKEAGLGNDQNIDYKCEAQGSATYVCVNHGGANPSASNKTTVSGPVSATGTFNSGKNGSIIGSLTVKPPSAGNFSCPNGQSMELARVSYTDVFLTDLTDSISLQLSNQSTGCLLPNVLPTSQVEVFAKARSATLFRDAHRKRGERARGGDRRLRTSVVACRDRRRRPAVPRGHGPQGASGDQHSRSARFLLTKKSPTAATPKSVSTPGSGTGATDL